MKAENRARFEFEAKESRSVEDGWREGKPGARRAGCRLASSSVSGAVPAWGTPASLACTVEGGGDGSLHHPRGLLQVRLSTTQF